MSEPTGAMPTDIESRPFLQLPMLVQHPRLRFVDGAPDGAAGNESADEEQQDEEEEQDGTEGQESLGDAGKKALDAMKAQRNAERLRAKTTQQELDRLKAELALKDKPAEEQALETARAEARADATKAANVRILKSELKAAATGKLADPTDAALYINLDDFDVNDDGDVDSDALNEAITTLLTRKPHLAAPTGVVRPAGSGDGGAKAPAKPTASLDERILAAQNAGDWKTAIALQNQKLPANAPQ